MALAAALAGLALFVGNPPIVSDEGAAMLQAHQLATGQGWLRADPVPTVDPDHRHFPVVNASCTADGCAPLAKHPLYAGLLSLLDRLGGVRAELALSVFGTWAAAVLAAVLARRLDPSLPELTLWVVGLGTPLLFDGYLVTAHTVAAALGAAATLCALSLRDRHPRSSLWMGLGTLAVVVGCCLRTEFVFFGLALAATLTVSAWRRTGQRRATAMAAAALGSATAVGWLADHFAYQWVLGGAAEGSSQTLATGTGSFFADRWSGFRHSFLGTGGGSGIAPVMPIVVVVVLALAAWRAARGAAGPAMLLACTAAAGALVWFATGSHGEPLTGFLAAMPLLGAAGHLLWSRRHRLDATSRFALAVCGGFATCVAATEYGVGGGWEWGGRYLALAIPLVVPVCLAAGRGTLAEPEGSVSKRSLVAVGGATLMATLVLSGTSVLVLKSGHDNTRGLVRAVDRRVTAVAPAGGTRVVLTDDVVLGRIVGDALDRDRWLLADSSELATVATEVEGRTKAPIMFVGSADGAEAMKDWDQQFRCESIWGAAYQLCQATGVTG